MTNALHAPKPAFFKVVALLATVHFLMALAMAASPELHHYFHHDADDGDHDCAVTHMMKGDFSDGAPVDAMTAVVRLPVMEHRLAVESGEVWVAPLYLENGVLEHAPPVMG